MTQNAPEIPYATVRKATNPAFGFIVSILGEDYMQEGSWAEAQDRADAINARCSTLSAAEVRRLYKLGAYSPGPRPAWPG